MKILAPYGVADPKRSALELVFTALPFLLLWALMLYGLESHGYWACLPLALPAAGFLVRLFMIQHDCGHGSFFRRRSSNDWIGRIIGVLTLTPYGYWRRTHAVHHATTGNLDRRGMGDVPLLTVTEYRALSRWRRIGYRLSRNPLVLLGLGPLFLFVLKYRLPVGLMRDGKGVWISAMSTNLAIASVVIGMCALVGIQDFLLVQLPITLLAGSAGVWLFYVQHEFEDTYWARQGAWSFQAGALQGATHYDLPGVLRSGSRPTSASITSITWRAGSPAIGCGRPLRIMPSFATSAASPCVGASSASASRSGTKRPASSSLFTTSRRRSGHEHRVVSRELPGLDRIELAE